MYFIFGLQQTRNVGDCVSGGEIQYLLRASSEYLGGKGIGFYIFRLKWADKPRQFLD